MATLYAITRKHSADNNTSTVRSANTRRRAWKNLVMMATALVLEIDGTGHSPEGEDVVIVTSKLGTFTVTFALEAEEHDGLTIITRNGQEVWCYGTWEWDSNADVVFEHEQFDGVWCDGADNWTQVVEELTAYAKRMGTRVAQISAC